MLQATSAVLSFPATVAVMASWDYSSLPSIVVWPMLHATPWSAVIICGPWLMVRVNGVHGQRGTSGRRLAVLGGARVVGCGREGAGAYQGHSLQAERLRRSVTGSGDCGASMPPWPDLRILPDFAAKIEDSSQYCKSGDVRFCCKRFCCKSGADSEQTA